MLLPLLRHYRDYLLTAGVAIAIALLVRGLWIEPFRIPTQAMRPNLLAGDTVFVTKRMPGPWGGWKPRLGDVVVYQIQNEAGKVTHHSIKRIVGFEGDLIEVRDGLVYRNGKSLWHPASAPKGGPAVCGIESVPDKNFMVCREPKVMDDVAPSRVPPGHFFLLSDLRTRPTGEAARRPTWALATDATVIGLARWIWISIEQPRDGVRESGGFFPTLRMDRFLRSIE